MKKKNPYKRKRQTMPSTRTVEQISQEYAQLAQKAGHIAYQISIMQEELNKAYDTMRALNVEASQIKETPSEQAQPASN